MVGNKKLILGIILLIVLTYFVIAAAGDGLKIITPSSGTNFSTISSVIFNVSFTNGTDITQPSNASFFINISGSWSKIGNTSATSGCNVGATTSSCTAGITNLTIPDGVYSINATIYNNTGAARISVTNPANLSTLIYIDSTKPIVFSSNISSPLTGANYSGSLTLNASVIDALVGVETVFFNITNNTGSQNSTVTLSHESGSSYSANINTQGYQDGYYNLTLYANDTVGNLNNSALVYRVIFDNNGPNVSFSCDDYSVEEDDTITCTCTSPSDSFSGVNTSYGTSGILFTDSSPSTSSTGTNFEVVCKSQDNVGNIGTYRLYYNVTGISSSITSGGSSGSSSGSSSSSSSSNSSSNSSTQNSSLGQGNILEGNQDNSEQSSISFSPWIIIGIIVVAIIGITLAVLKKKGLLKLNKK